MADPVTAAIFVGATAVGAYGTYQSGQQQQRLYNLRSQQATLSSRQEMLREKQKGVQVLQKISATLAAVNARAAAGAMDPYSGTPGALREFALSEGMQDYTISRENAQLIEQIGILQSIDYKQAGANAAYQGRIGAITQIGQAALSYNMLGSAPASKPPVFDLSGGVLTPVG
jgi:hypothetical protein